MTSSIHKEDAEILENRQIGTGLFLMRLRAPDIASKIGPAQFVQVQTDPELAPFLRRPFSALRVDRTAGWVDILYEVIGRGTGRMATCEPGTRLNLLGPLVCRSHLPIQVRCCSWQEVSALYHWHSWCGNMQTSCLEPPS